MSTLTESPDTPLSNVVTGVRYEEKIFIWRIENFAVVQKSDSLVNAQKFTFEIGESIGLPCEFICFLNRNQAEAASKEIGIHYELKEKPDGVEETNVAFRIEILKEDGVGNVFSGKVELKNLADTRTPDWGFRVKPDQQFPLEGGALRIRLLFKLFAALPPATVKTPPTQRAVPETPPRGLTSSLANLTQDDFPFSDVKIISKEGSEFKAHRNILAARSPVFRRMFESNMEEAQTGVVRMEDISGDTVKVLLHYICTSSLLPEWPEIAVELTYASDKYQLQDLISELDREVGKFCSVENVGKLLVLAKKIPLKQAEKELARFIKSSSLRKVAVILENTVD